VNHVAIDLGSKTSQVCVRAADGQVLFERKHPTQRLDELMQSWPRCRVVMETSSEAFRIADAARAAGHEVRVVRSTLAKQLGVGDRQIKTDLRDARALSEVSTRIDLPSVHIPSSQARHYRARVQSRECLVASRTQLINHVRGWLRTQLLTIRKGTTMTFPERTRDVATHHQREIATHILHTLTAIDALNEQIALATKELHALAKASSLCQRLMTVPGVGPITAISFVGAIDDVSRFPNAHRVASYLGLTPGENSSSLRERRTGITKAGPSTIRKLLVQAAWVPFVRRPNEPMVMWAKRVAERRPRPVAVVALARKMAGILFALWRDQTTYRASKPVTPTQS
jgi:transposase